MEAKEFVKLTPTQLGMLYHCLERPNDSLYISQAEIRLNEKINVSQLWKAWHIFFSHHEILRSAIIQSGSGEYLLAIYDNILPITHFIDLSRKTTSSQKKFIAIFKDKDRKRKLLLEKPPLMRLTLFKLKADHYQLLCTYHHILLCAPSAISGLKEVFQTYSMLSKKLTPILDHGAFYKETLENLNKNAEKINKDYWQKILKDYVPSYPLPFNATNIIKTAGLKKFELSKVPHQLNQKIKLTCKSMSVTPSMIFQLAWGILILKYTNQDDLVIGSVRAFPANKTVNCLGLFINTLPLRIQYKHTTTVMDCLTSIKNQVRGFKTQNYISLSELQSHLGYEPGAFLFNTAIDFKPYDYLRELRKTDPSWHNRKLSFHTETHYPLMLEIWNENNSLLIKISYDNKLFETWHIKQLSYHLLSIIQQIAEKPTERVANLSMLTAIELDTIKKWNSTSFVYKNFCTIPELLTLQAKKYPRKTAVEFSDSALSYAAFEEITNKVAAYLSNNGDPTAKYVAICLDRSLEMMIAIYGIWKAGLAYVPLDPAWPKTRKKLLLSKITPRFLLTQKHYTGKLEIQPRKMIDVGALISSLRNKPLIEPFKVKARPDGTSYVIFTSGTTGEPKGVMISHESLVNRILWMQSKYKLKTKDIILQKTPYTFDVSLWEFCWPLISGAKLVISKPHSHREPLYIQKKILRSKVTTLHFVPSMLRLFLTSLDHKNLKSLRYVFSSGEVLPSDLVEDFYKKIPHAKLINLYGPTEATVDVSYYECKPADKRNHIPIGKPIYNTQLYVLDNYLNLMPPGTPGELYIGGINVAQGYLGQPDLSNEKFLNVPQINKIKLYKTGDIASWRKDGQLLWHGRIDSQIKLNGYRIELEEIENSLRKLPGLKEVAVTLINRQLIAFFSRNSKSFSHAESLTLYLKKLLPSYMLPHRFIKLHKFPLTNNGKLDRKSLIQYAEHNVDLSTKFELARTNRERHLVEIWKKILKKEEIGINDDFYMLGGDSIKCIQIVGLARQQGISCSIEQLLQARTIKKLCETLIKVENTPSLVKHQINAFSLIRTKDKNKLLNTKTIEDAYPLTTLQQGMVFNKILAGQQAVYQDVFHYKLQGRFDKNFFIATWKKLSSYYEVLRTSFNLTDFQDPIQLVYKDVILPIEIVDYSQNPRDKNYKETLKKLIHLEQTTALNILTPPLYRIKILVISQKRFDMIFTFHHAILDGWSISLLIKDLITVYNNFLKEKNYDLSTTEKYASYVAYEKQLIKNKIHTNFWKKQTRKFEKFYLAINYSKTPSTNQKHDQLTEKFSKEEFYKLEQLSKTEKLDFQDILLAAHTRLLMMLSGKKKVLSAVVTHSRPPTNDAVNMVGLFLNTIPLSIELADETWLGLIHRISKLRLEISPHQGYPWREILKLVDASDLKLTDILFNYTDLYLYDNRTSKDGIKIIDGTAFEYTEFPLVLHFNLLKPKLKLELNLVFDTQKISRDFAKHIICYVKNIINHLLNRPTGKYFNHHFLKHQDIAQLNGPRSTTPSKTVLNFIKEQAEKTPDKIAVVDQEKKISFLQLEVLSNQAANYLILHGAKPNTIIAVCLDKSVDMVVALLGILKSGATYLPLAPHLPKRHIRSCLVISKASILLIAEQNRFSFNQNTTTKFLHFSIGKIGAYLQDEPASPCNITQPMYVIFTSGTTGRPKAVSIKHKSVMNVLHYFIKLISLSSNDIFLNISEITFDISVLEIFSPLITGGTLVVAPSRPLQNLETINRLVKEYQVTTIQATPTYLSQLFNSIRLSQSINKILCGGETFPLDLAEKLMRCKVRIWNVYGPTETTIWSTQYEINEKALHNSNILPIGSPISNTSIYIVDEAGNPLPRDVSGSILITGEGIAKNYLYNSSSFLTNCFLQFDKHVAFKTNDKGFINENQTLIFQGRTDRVQKIAGYFVNLEDVEYILRKKFDLKKIVALFLEEDETSYIAICLHKSLSIKQSQIIKELTSYHPFQLLPLKIFYIKKFPITPSGKTDNIRLAEIIKKNSALHRKNEVLDQSNKTLIRLWCKALNISPNSLDSRKDFFASGGNSLGALRLLHEINRILKVDIKVSNFINNPTLHFLIEAEKNIHYSLPEDITAEYSLLSKIPFTYEQEQIWFSSRGDKSNDYHLVAILKIYDALNVDILIKALQTMITQHPLLYSRVKTERNSYFFEINNQENRYSSFFSYNLKDREQLSDIELILNHPLDLTKEPPLRVCLLETKNQNTYLAIVVHHLIADHETLKLLIQNLSKLYSDSLQSKHNRVPPPKISDAYIQHFNKRPKMENEQEARQFWRQYLSADFATYLIPPDISTENTSISAGKPIFFTLSSSQQEKLKNFSETNDVSLFHIIASTWGLFLCRYTNNKNILIAMPTSLREHGWQQEIIANFANTIYLQFSSNDLKNFKSFVKNFKITWQNIHKNRSFPVISEFPHITKPQIMLVFNELEHSTCYFGHTKAELFEHSKMDKKFDVTLFIEIRPNEIRLALHYNPTLFSSELMKLALYNYIDYINELALNPTTSWKNLGLTSRNNLVQIRKLFNGRKDPTVSKLDLLSLFKERVAKSFNLPAIYFESHYLTFHDLNEKANELASYISSSYDLEHNTIVFSLNTSPEAIITIVACLLLNCQYIPLDINNPRNELLLSSIAYDVFITTKLSYIPTSIAHKKTLLFENTIFAHEKNTIKSPTKNQELLYTIFTSGSTGLPKGVQIKHSSAVNYISWAIKHYGICEGQNIPLLSSLTTDMSVTSLWGSLISGACLWLFSHENPLFHFNTLAHSGSRFDFAKLTPSQLKMLSRMQNGVETIKELRTIVLGGEALNYEDFSFLEEIHFRTHRIYNEYGPTESTVACTCYQISSSLQKGRVPIGRPIQNTSVMVLDDYMKPLPLGAIGEIYVTGTSLARGYINGQTNSDFVIGSLEKNTSLLSYKTGDIGRFLPNNQLEFLGRYDKQINIGGFRIECAEIESVLLSLEGINDCLVRSINNGNIIGIEAFISATSPISYEKINNFLRESLPKSMIPNRYYLVEKFSYFPSGKLDIQAIEEKAKLLSAKISFNSNENLKNNYIATHLQDIWVNLLKQNNVDINQPIFELGASSLMILKAYDALTATLPNIAITIEDFYKYPTISSLAQHLNTLTNKPSIAISDLKLSSEKEDVAVIGMAINLPGANTLEYFWDNLLIGKCSIRKFDIHDLIKQGVPSTRYEAKNFVSSCGYLEDIDKFDANLFKISEYEASLRDPQHRLFLELCWEILVKTGYEQKKSTSKIGIFGSCSDSAYALEMVKDLLASNNLTDSKLYEIQLHTSKDFISSWAAYKLNLNGPAISINTACSSSLVSIIKASQALLANECHIAIAGASSLILPSYLGYLYTEGSIFSKSGVCRPFDKAADGTVPGSGAGVVMLKRLSEAIIDGDPIYAVISGFAINNDGNKKVSFMGPSLEGQVTCLKEALSCAEIPSDQVEYIEAHGTGTPIGDTIELEAIKQVYGEQQNNHKNKCFIGSLKANIGHLDAAAGIAGFIKTVMSLHKCIIPPNPHSGPHESLSSSRFELPLTPQNYSEPSINYAAVSSFGIGGTNAHIILRNFNQPYELSSRKNTADGKIFFNRKSYWFNRKTIQYNPPSIKPAETFDNVKEKLRAIWQKNLLVDEVSDNADFHFFGGDSWSLLSLIAEINSVFNITLTPSDILAYRQFNELEKLVKEKIAKQTTRCDIKPNAIHLALLPPVTGQTLCYLPLMRMFENDGISSCAFDIPLSAGKNLKTVSEIAYYICSDIVNQFTKNEKILLCGYSMGGILSLIISDRLKDLGYDVGGIVLIDSWAKVSILQKDRLYLRSKFKKLAKESGYSLTKELFDEYIEQTYLRMEAIATYKPHKLQNPVSTFLIKAGKLTPEFKAISSPTNHWASYLNINRTYITQANHDNLLQEPYVKEIMSALLDILKLTNTQNKGEL